MGFLVKSGFPAFSKAVFSFWFRIPAELFTIMDAIPFPPDPLGSASGDTLMLLHTPPFYQIAPLMSFGTVETDISTGGICCPSFMGIDCSRGAGFEKLLACRLQTPINGEAPGDPLGIPGAFYVNGNADGSVIAGPALTPNAWHHGLVSFDISGSCSTHFEGLDKFYTSSCTLTWAIDDVAQGRVALSPSGDYNGLGDTEIITNWNSFANDPGGPDPPDTSSFSGGIIGMGDFSFPAGPSVSDKVRKIQMAKVQVFTGVTLDARSVTNRRAFIGADRRPASPSAGAALLGKAPAIHFDTKDDWINGRNRGTAGNFTKTGTISPYSGTVGL